MFIRKPSDVDVAVFVSKIGVSPRANVEIVDDVEVPVSYPALTEEAVRVELIPADKPATVITPVCPTVTAALPDELVTFHV